MYFASSFHTVIWNFFRNNYPKTPFSGRCFLCATDRKKGVDKVESDYLPSCRDRDERFLLGFWLCDFVTLVKGVIATDSPSRACGKAAAKLCFPAGVSSDASCVCYQRCRRFCSPAHCVADQDVSRLWAAEDEPAGWRRQWLNTLWTAFARGTPFQTIKCRGFLVLCTFTVTFQAQKMEPKVAEPGSPGAGAACFSVSRVAARHSKLQNWDEKTGLRTDSVWEPSPRKP